MYKQTIILFILVLLTSCNKRASSERKQENKINTSKDSLTFELNEIYKQGHINGFSVAIVNSDKVLYENGIGFADIDKKIKYTENTVQNIASISKTLIGIALLKAQEMGKLKLDDPINKYLPYKIKNPYFPAQPITIRHLATHTSSIIDADVYDEQSYILKTDKDSSVTKFSEMPENFNSPEKKTPITDFLQNVLYKNGKWYSKESFLNKKPGELFEYSNVGATLAASVLEYATGKSYNEFTSIYILKPLGMNSSGWSFNEIDLSKHSKLYKTPTARIPFYSLITYPDGGLITSSQDLSKYLIELIRGYSENGTLLTNESYNDLFATQLDDSNFTERDSENPYDDEYNSGIFMGFSAKGYIGHTGSDPGVSTLMFFDSKTKIGRILLMNTSLINSEGLNQFFSVWNKLEEYQEKLE